MHHHTTTAGSARIRASTLTDTNGGNNTDWFMHIPVLSRHHSVPRHRRAQQRGVATHTNHARTAGVKVSEVASTGSTNCSRYSGR